MTDLGRRLALLALLTAMASILYGVETTIGSPFPWIRLGLANVVTLLVLHWWGLKEGSIVTLFRVILGSLIIGRLFQPVFFFSLTGGLVSVLTMYAVMSLRFPKFGFVGISIIGSLSKNGAQLILAHLFYIRQANLFGFLPVMAILSVLTGFIVGSIAFFIHQRIPVDRYGV